MKLVIYVIHSPVVKARLSHISNLIETLKKSQLFDGVDVTLVDEHECDKLTPDIIKASTDFSKFVGEFESFNEMIQPVHVRNVSNLLKHSTAIARVAKGSADDVHLIIEDDVVFGGDVSRALYDSIVALGSTYDIAFLGLPSAQIAGEVEDTGKNSPFEKFYNVSPVCDSYLLTPVGAGKLNVLPMKFPTNFQLSYALRKGQLRARFTRPNVFIDGSKIGVFVSSINANNSLILSSEHQAFAQKLETSIEDARILYDAMRFKAHPDSMKLLADAEHKAGNFEKSRKLYEACFAAYKDGNCVLTNQSQFMRSYIVACRDFPA